MVDNKSKKLDYRLYEPNLNAWIYSSQNSNGNLVRLWRHYMTEV